MSKLEKASWAAAIGSVVFTAGWSVWTYLYPAEERKAEQSAPTTATATGNTVNGNNSQQAIAVGGNAIATGSGSVTIVNGQNLSMSIVRGYYTLCPKYPVVGSNGDWGRFLRDIYEHRSKIVFMDVEVHVHCADDKPEDEIFTRLGSGDSVTYSFDHSFVRLNPKNDLATYQKIIPDNGLQITIHQNNNGANAFSKLNIYSEGMADIIYGPFQIKSSGEDGFIHLDLHPPILDSVMIAEASKISASLK